MFARISARSVFGVLTSAALGTCMSVPIAAHADEAHSFEEASIIFEQNATDGDVEVVLKAQGGDEGLSKFSVVGPNGRSVVEVRAPDASTLGIREFSFESPEPKDIASLKAAYPEGVYRFSGTTVGGEQLHGQSTLSHRLPVTASLLRPLPGAQNVAADLVISWKPVDGVTGFIIAIEQEELETQLTVELPGDALSFAVPAGFLRGGLEYSLGIGTVSADHNVSFVESTFTVAQ
jgi:hypothetical protein